MNREFEATRRYLLLCLLTVSLMQDILQTEAKAATALPLQSLEPVFEYRWRFGYSIWLYKVS